MLQSSYLSEANATTVKAGMEITNVVGTFQQASTSYMTNIKVKKADIASIEIKKEGVSVSPQVVAFEDYMANIDKYEGMSVRFENVNIRQIAGTTINEIYSLTSDAKLTVSFTNAHTPSKPCASSAVSSLSFVSKYLNSMPCCSPYLSNDGLS